jgi:hypothetical protein
VLRLLFTSFAMSLVLIGVVVIALTGSGTAEPDRPAASVVAAGVVAYGVLSLFAPRVIERPLDCTDETALLSGYRTRLFLRIAFAHAAALVGFVGFSLSRAKRGCIPWARASRSWAMSALPRRGATSSATKRN